MIRHEYSGIGYADDALNGIFIWRSFRYGTTDKSGMSPQAIRQMFAREKRRKRDEQDIRDIVSILAKNGIL